MSEATFKNHAAFIWSVADLRVDYPGRAAVVTDDLDGSNCASILIVRKPRALRAHLLVTYDFGDVWEHDVVVEAIESPETGTRYPTCLDGAQACPPDDCGGVPGYGHLLPALADPQHPEHDEYAQWAPDRFDPAVFDLAATNRRLRGR